MLQTLERTNIFDARVLTAAHADALRALAGPGHDNMLWLRWNIRR